MKNQNIMDFSEISAEFIKAGLDHLKAIKEELAEISVKPSKKEEAIKSSFRHLHSLKGAAMLLGFEKSAAY